MKASKLIERLQDLVQQYGDETVLLDTGMCLCVVDEVDMAASDEGIIIWAGDIAAGEK
jgi:hypothetical protein